MRRYRRRKWILLAILALGTTFQVSACREDAALFGLRVAFYSVTLPINQLVRSILLNLN